MYVAYIVLSCCNKDLIVATTMLVFFFHNNNVRDISNKMNKFIAGEFAGKNNVFIKVHGWMTIISLELPPLSNS